MKKLFILIVLLFAAPAWSLEMEFKHSEPASYLHFMAAGFDEPFTSGSVKELIKESKSNVFQRRSLKKEFELLNSYLQKGYNYPNEVQNRPQGFWAESALYKLAVNAKDMQDFEKQLSVVLSYEAINAYQKIKTKTYPLFLKIMWKPSLKDQDNQEAELNMLLEKSRFVDLLERAKTFYESDYPDSLPFKVGLIPIPYNKKKRHTSATNLNDIQAVPYFIDHGIRDNLDVIFHEFCHALYGAQPKKVQEKINDFYLKQKDPHSIFVYRYLNEALATALGNGLYVKWLEGELNDKDWYAVKYIDGLAKAYLPLIESYISKKKPMDKAFMKKTIEIAKKVFPKGPQEIAPNFMAIQLLSETNDGFFRSIKTDIRKFFRVQSMHSSAPVLIEDIRESVSNPFKTIVLVSKDAQKFQAKLKPHIDLQSVFEKAPKDKAFWAIVPFKGSYLFWINADNEKDFAKLASKVKQLDILPSETIHVF